MAEPLKDQFDTDVVTLLATRFGAVDPDFDGERFSDHLIRAFPSLELKERINLTADELASELPEDYPSALRLVLAVLEVEDQPPVEGFAAWPLCSFVERHGLDHPRLSLPAMEPLTRRMSCEFAIRPYLDAELTLTRSFLDRWVHDDDEHLRRLVSEGTRPRLPWGPKVQALLDDPEIGIALLHQLRHDPSETVRRSVANHLNDIARADPDRVVAVIGEWSIDPTVDPAMIRHALRSLVKKGHPGALTVLGFTTDPSVDIQGFSVSPSTLSLGSDIELQAELTSTVDDRQRLVVDFVVHHVGANGSTIPKVFKWTTIDLDPRASIGIRKRRRIQTASTRRYHAGEHRVDLQVAGQVMASAAFDLVDSSG